MTPPELSKISCWVLSEGFASLHNQALGIADRLGVVPELKTVRAQRLLRSLPPRWWLGARGFAGLQGDALGPPWPDLVIGCGGQGALGAYLVRRASGGESFAVQIQSPALPNEGFDVLVVPRHDRRAGANVVETIGAVHRVTPGRLAAAAEQFRDRLAALPSPRVAVLLGGSNRRYRLGPGRLAAIARDLAALARGGAGLMVTASRRSGPEAQHLLAEALAGTASHVWDGTGDNPYLGYLALADTILVTRDSVSMTSEAVSTGKPVLVIGLDGRSRRIERFHAEMEERGFTRPFAGRLESWSYAPPDETGRAAERIRTLLEARLAARRAALGAPRGLFREA
jgi:hypothetical protein